MNGGWWQYAAVFVGSTTLSLIVTPVMVRIAVRWRLLDVPGQHKSHFTPTPYLGGIAMASGFGVAVVVAARFDSSTAGDDELLAILAVAFALAVLGLIDDLRGLSARVRLFVELLASLVVFGLDVGVAVTGHDLVDLVLTVVWVVGIINAFNLVDNMDGLSGGLAAIASAWFFVIAIDNGQFLVAALAAGLAGCAVGFLKHNVHPASIYMGDAGAYFLGFLVAYLGLKIQLRTTTSDVSFLAPVIVCAVVILDTALVTFTRLRVGRSPFVGGRDHLSHRLLHRGGSVTRSVGMIWVLAVVYGASAFWVTRSSTTIGWTVSGCVAVSLVSIGIGLARIPVHVDDSNQ